MSQLPRIAIGTIQAQADPTAILWALMDALERNGLRVQHFLSQAYFAPRDGATAITGLSPRHLDSWLMSQEVCRDSFVRGCRASDLAVVEGSFAAAAGLGASSGFETMCGWLDMPRLAVVDVRLLADCQLPERPAEIDGLLLDRVQDAAELYRLQTLFEAIWKVPVLGTLGAADKLRDSIAAIPPGRRPSLELCHALGDQLTPHADLQRIYKLARRRRLAGGAARPGRRAGVSECRPSLRVAVAYDDAFHCYFPDTLDLLEANGATICDFSPLRDERLPLGTDVVYLGCGHPELFAEALAENNCIMLAIKSHLCSGRRMYAECGGLAYLCHEIELPDGRRWPMVGAIPATARLDATPTRPAPIEITLANDTWLGPAAGKWRGYLNPRWSLGPSSALCGCAGEAAHQFDVVQRHQAVGSRLHMNFAAQSDLLDSFFEPHTVAAGTNDPQRSA
jgi:cobyrinic acid a,c-diamide synthase